jgi:hypothetical protein
LPTKSLIRRYISYLADNAKRYKTFNKQLIVGELAGIAGGLLIAELGIALLLDEASISITSSAADYLAALSGFLAIFYVDNRGQFMHLGKGKRVKKVCVMALRLWPSIAAADIVFLAVRPYVQYTLLTTNMEAGLTSIAAHFIAFAAFNITATFSRSLTDFWRSTKNPQEEHPS